MKPTTAIEELRLAALFRKHLPIVRQPPEMAERVKKRVLAAVAAKWPQANGQRIIAIGRSEAGGPFKVTAPADWPTEDEVEAIIAGCPPKPYTIEDELEARAEERRSQF